MCKVQGRGNTVWHCPVEDWQCGTVLEDMWNTVHIKCVQSALPEDLLCVRTSSKSFSLSGQVLFQDAASSHPFKPRPLHYAPPNLNLPTYPFTGEQVYQQTIATPQVHKRLFLLKAPFSSFLLPQDLEGCQRGSREREREGEEKGGGVSHAYQQVRGYGNVFIHKLQRVSCFRPVLREGEKRERGEGQGTGDS